MRYEIQIDSDSDKTALIMFSFSQPVQPAINVQITKDVSDYMRN